MNSGQLSDPLNPLARALKTVTGRRTKTEADHIEMGRLEFIGSLWWCQAGPCLIGEAVEACLKEGARKTKEGKIAEVAIMCPEVYPIDFEGPREHEALWADPQYRLRVAVKVGQSRVHRTRPRFEKWGCFVAVQFNDEWTDRQSVVRWATTAGAMVGIGNWRPRFGRFTVEAL